MIKLLTLLSLQTAGLGGMKPNTLAMGFFNESIPIDQLGALRLKLSKRLKVVRSLIKDQSLEKFDVVTEQLPRLRVTVSAHTHTLAASLIYALVYTHIHVSHACTHTHTYSRGNSF